MKAHTHARTHECTHSLPCLNTNVCVACAACLLQLVQKGSLNQECLQALTACCRELGQFETIVEIYEAQHKMNPNDEEIACSVSVLLSSLVLCQALVLFAKVSFQPSRKDSHSHQRIIEVTRTHTHTHTHTHTQTHTHTHTQLLTRSHSLLSCAVQLFMALVRTKQYKRQQQLGLAMFKLFGNTVHYYWAVMSCVMQADAAAAAADAGAQPVVMGASMFLTMADRMLTKAVADGIFTGPEHLRLHLLVHEMRGDWEVSLRAGRFPHARSFPWLFTSFFLLSFF
jgi:hypothetical protein